MDVLSSRVIVRPRNLEASHRFYRETLGLAVAREFGSGEHHGVVFFTGQGLLEVSGRDDSEHGSQRLTLWLQVRDVAEETARLALEGVPIERAPMREPWGLIEAWIADPDGVKIVLVQIPEDHPLRLDLRG